MKHIELDSYLHQQYSEGAKRVIKDAVVNVKTFLSDPTYWTLEVPANLLSKGLKTQTDGASVLQIQIPQILLQKTDSPESITKIIERTHYFKTLKQHKDRKIQINMIKKRIQIK
jgi:hypothetical protein